MAENQFIRQDSAFRREYGITKNPTLNIKADADIYDVSNKIASYIYKNSVTTEEDVVDALKAKLVHRHHVGACYDSQKDNIERIENPKDITEILKNASMESSIPKDGEEYKGFIFLLEKENKNARFVIVDDKVSRPKHGESRHFSARGSYHEEMGVKICTKYKADLLVGHDKILRSLWDYSDIHRDPNLTGEEIQEKTNRIVDSYRLFILPKSKEIDHIFDTKANEKLFELDPQVKEYTNEYGGKSYAIDFEDISEKGYDYQEKSFSEKKGRHIYKDRIYTFEKDGNSFDVRGDKLNSYAYPSIYQQERREKLKIMDFFDKTIRHIHQDEMNYQMMEKYDRDTAKEVATAWTTKKNIPEQTQKAMDESLFKKNFGFVEYDEGVDLEKMKNWEKEWEKLSPHMPKADTVPDLRFRLLGKHRAAGIWVNGANSIGIDPRDERSTVDGDKVVINGIRSFVHEYAHYLDYRTKNNDNGLVSNLSMQSEFSPILDEYQKRINEKSDVFTGRGKYDADYYKTPTEVFARGFEVYFSKFDNIQTSLAQDSSMLRGVEYDAFKGMEDKLADYFEKTFPDIEHNFKSFNLNEEMGKSVDINNEEIIKEFDSQKAWKLEHFPKLALHEVTIGELKQELLEDMEDVYRDSPEFETNYKAYSNIISNLTDFEELREEVLNNYEDVHVYDQKEIAELDFESQREQLEEEITVDSPVSEMESEKNSMEDLQEKANKEFEATTGKNLIEDEKQNFPQNEAKNSLKSLAMGHLQEWVAKGTSGEPETYYTTHNWTYVADRLMVGMNDANKIPDYDNSHVGAYAKDMEKNLSEYQDIKKFSDNQMPKSDNERFLIAYKMEVLNIKKELVRGDLEIPNHPNQEIKNPKEINQQGAYKKEMEW